MRTTLFISTTILAAYLVSAGLISTSWASSAEPVFELAALRVDNTLVLFRSDAPATSRNVRISGVDGEVVGIDIRPLDGKLYALTTQNTLYTVEPSTGVAKRVSRLGTAFRGAFVSGFDINPQADRLRLVAGTGQNLRINLDVGAVAIDGSLTYASDDRHAGVRPQLVASAYTQSIANAHSTVLFNIDAARDTLVKQDPPNDGVLITIGKLGIDCGEAAGFDIATHQGEEYPFAVCGFDLFKVNLKSGVLRPMGRIQTDPSALVGLAVLRPIQ